MGVAARSDVKYFSALKVHILSEDSNTRNFVAGSLIKTKFESGTSKADTYKRISFSHTAFISIDLVNHIHIGKLRTELQLCFRM